MRWWIGVVVALVLACATPVRTAAAADARADLEKAEQLYANLNYEEANKVAQTVVRQRNLSHDQLVRAYRILAISHAVLDREEASRDAFVMLLTYEPDYQADPNLGPRVTTPFFEARGFWRGQPVKPGAEASATAKVKEPAVVRVQVRDPSHIVKRAVVGWRWGPAGPFKTKPVTTGDAQNVEIGPPPTGASRLDYYVQAFDDKENVILEAGSSSTPKTTTVEEPQVASGGGGAGSGREGGGEKKSGGGVFSSAGFWGVALGVVVVGGAAAVFALTRPNNESSTATFSSTLNCGGVRCN